MTVYFGWPAIEYASVDLPEPFGPMIAWVSPSLMVRSTPLRISLGPSSVSTETCRSLISSVAMSVRLLIGVSRSMSTSSPSILDGVDGTGSVAGGPVGLPVRRSKREPCSQHSIAQSSTSPSDSATAACEHSSSIAKTSSPSRTMATSRPSTSTRSGRAVGRARRARRRARRSCGQQPCDRRSSRAPPRRCSISCSSSSGTPILRIRSLKKPCTTRRRASASSMPRERR